jgi:hypothetical protein
MPTGDLAVSHCGDVRPLGLERLLRVLRNALLVTKHRDVVAGLDELPRFKDGQFIEASQGGEKVGDFSWISSQRLLAPAGCIACGHATLFALPPRAGQR